MRERRPAIGPWAARAAAARQARRSSSTRPQRQRSRATIRLVRLERSASEEHASRARAGRPAPRVPLPGLAAAATASSGSRDATSSSIASLNAEHHGPRSTVAGDDQPLPVPHRLKGLGETLAKLSRRHCANRPIPEHGRPFTPQYRARARFQRPARLRRAALHFLAPCHSLFVYANREGLVRGVRRAWRDRRILGQRGSCVRAGPWQKTHGMRTRSRNYDSRARVGKLVKASALKTRRL